MIDKHNQNTSELSGTPFKKFTLAYKYTNHELLTIND